MSLSWLFDTLRAVADFQHWRRRLAGVEGFLADLEGYALLRLAAHGGACGAVIETGSYLGRSTAFLAAGSKAAGRERVVAVDHFRGSPEHQPGAFPSATLAREGTTYRRFQQNLARLGLDDYVTPVVASSAEAAARWRGPIRLLFIDGDHDFESVRQDFRLWSPFVAPRGLVCFHDVGNAPGVTDFYRSVVGGGTAYREAGVVLSLGVAEKAGPPAAPVV